MGRWTQGGSRLGPLAGFAAGLALGAGLIIAAAPTGPAGAAARAEAAPSPGTLVIRLDFGGPDIRIAGGKAALRDAPPRPLAAPSNHAAITPVKTAPGRRALAAPAPAAADTRPAIALVIDDLGVAADRSARALALPEAVTLSFLPHGGAALPLARAAAAEGHEIFLHVPMEPEGDADPGPGALRVGDSGAVLRDRLAAQIQLFAGSVPLAGVNNHMGSRATADARLMAHVMAVAGAYGAVYLDSLTTRASVAREAARAAGVPFIARDIFIDPAAGPDVVLAQLDAAEALARARGVAVAIAHPHDTTLDILEVWVRGLEAKGIRLAPVTEALRLQRLAAPGPMLASVR